MYLLFVTLDQDLTAHFSWEWKRSNHITGRLELPKTGNPKNLLFSAKFLLLCG